MAAPQKRQQVFAPLKGSFPIDHFKECDSHYQNYITCLQEHRNDTAKCRAQTKDYMQCRMDKNLMEKQELKDLGLEAKDPKQKKS